MEYSSSPKKHRNTEKHRRNELIKNELGKLFKEKSVPEYSRPDIRGCSEFALAFRMFGGDIDQMSGRVFINPSGRSGGLVLYGC